MFSLRSLPPSRCFNPLIDHPLDRSPPKVGTVRGLPDHYSPSIGTWCAVRCTDYDWTVGFTFSRPLRGFSARRGGTADLSIIPRYSYLSRNGPVNSEMAWHFDPSGPIANFPRRQALGNDFVTKYSSRGVFGQVVMPRAKAQRPRSSGDGMVNQLPHPKSTMEIPMPKSELTIHKPWLLTALRDTRSHRCGFGNDLPRMPMPSSVPFGFRSPYK